MGRAEFVRADIRNPLIAKVISERRGRHRRARIAVGRPRRPSGGRAAMKEMNVIGTMQLLAACQKAPRVRRRRAQVDHRRLRRRARATRRCSPRRWTPKALPVRRVRQGRRRDRGLRARLRPPPPGRLGHRAAVRQLHRPPHRHRAHPLLRAAGRADRARLRRPGAAAARGGRARRAGARGPRGRCRACSTSAADGVLLLSQAIRRAGRVPLPVPQPAGRRRSAAVPDGPGWSTSRPSRCGC